MPLTARSKHQNIKTSKHQNIKTSRAVIEFIERLTNCFSGALDFLNTSGSTSTMLQNHLIAIPQFQVTSLGLGKRIAVLLISLACNLAYSPQAAAFQDSGALLKKNVDDNTNQSKPVEKSEEEVVIVCQAVIDRRTSGGREFVTSEIDVSSLEAGARYRLDITVINPYESAITFSAASLSCGCGKFVGSSREIPGFGNAQFKLSLTVPNHISEGRSVQTVSFSGTDPSQTVLTLRVSYDVSNAFAFARDRVLIEIPKSEGSFRAIVPVLLIPPMNKEGFDLIVSENLQDLSVRISEADEHSDVPYVLLEAPRKIVPSRGVRGEIVLKRRGSGLESRVHVTIIHKERISLRPESLRLYRDNVSKPFQATAVLRVHREKGVAQEHREKGVAQEGVIAHAIEQKNQTDGGQAYPPPQVELTIGGVLARVLVNQLGTSEIYKLTIYCDGLPESEGGETDENYDVQWMIRVNGEERVISSQAFFSNR